MSGPGTVGDVAQQLLDALVQELGATLAGPPARVSLAPGATVPADVCCPTDVGHGQAAVRVAQLYPSSSFPTQATTASNCWSWTWAAQLEMTVYRCAAMVDDDGDPPDPAYVTHDARVVASDAAAMVRAAGCGLSARAVLPGAWSPMGPNGGCAGGSMSLWVDLGPA